MSDVRQFSAHRRSSRVGTHTRGGWLLAGVIALTACLLVGCGRDTGNKAAGPIPSSANSGSTTAADVGASMAGGTAPARTPSAPAADLRDGSPGPAAGGAEASATPDPSAVYIGVWQPGAPGDMSALTQFEARTGVHAGIVAWYQSWDNLTEDPDIAQLEAVAEHGSVPFITWESQDYRNGSHQPQFSLAQILGGRYDDYVRRWAVALANYGKPVLLRWGHEMNGNWYAWGNGVDGNTAEQFVAAWRHLHDIFTAAGANNVEWVWTPNLAGNSKSPLEIFYPGDSYVDWVGLDGSNRETYGWRTFTDLFESSYKRVTALTSKPFIIGEMGCGEAPNDPAGDKKAAWLTSTFTHEIPQKFPRIRAFVWFNENKIGVEDDGEDWSLHTPNEWHAFGAAISQPPYVQVAPPLPLR